MLSPPSPQILDATEPFERDPSAPFRMPIIDKYKEMGTIVMGKSESGLVAVGDKLMVMPNKCACHLLLHLIIKSAVTGILKSSFPVLRADCVRCRRAYCYAQKARPQQGSRELSLIATH